MEKNKWTFVDRFFLPYTYVQKKFKCERIPCVPRLALTFFVHISNKDIDLELLQNNNLDVLNMEKLVDKIKFHIVQL
jgi:hypothetical protein